MSGSVTNPVSSNISDNGNNTQQDNYDHQGNKLFAECHALFYTANSRKNVFKFNVTAVTVPVVASGLVSVFTLYNPPGSGVLAEIIYTQLGQVLATTVVNVHGWYFSNATLTAAGTFTTKAVALTNYFSGRVGDTPAGMVVPYLAYTHSGTPIRCDVIDTDGATTAAGNVVIQKKHDGTLILPPGIAMSIATSTAADTSSGTDLEVCWSEWGFM